MTPTSARDVAGTLMPGFAGTELPAWLDARLRDGLGGVCLFAENVVSPAQVRELTAAVHRANPRAVIAIDEEGGDVTRLHAATGSPFPGNAVLGRLDDVALTERVAREVGRQVREAGITLDLAPDVDVNSNPDNPVIGVRSFGADPELVARHSAAWVRGLQSAGVAASAKHFPGHGDTAQDSHRALPVVDLPLTRLEERELAPFRAAVEAGALTVMSSHILLPQLDDAQPATFSRPVLHGLLRGRLGFDGVIVTDALDMAGASEKIGIPRAAVRALAGGCDLLCIGTRNTDAQLGEIERAVLDAIAAGELDGARVRRARDRVASLAERTAAATGRETEAAHTPDAEPVDVATVARAFDDRSHLLLEASGSVETLSWVAIRTTPNIAMGEVPWGPFAAGVTPAATVDPQGPQLQAVLDLPEGRPIVLVGKDNHRHAWVRDLVDGVRARRPVTVVDMGWPHPDRRYADLATFGASRLVGRALLDYLSRRR